MSDPLPSTAKPSGWHRAFDDILERLPDLVARSRLTLCGLSTCVDVYLRLEQADALLAADPTTPEGRLAARLLERAYAGVGGEIRVDWPDGPAWLDAHVPTTVGLGGTGAQAGQMLACLCAPTLVAVADRTARQLGCFHPAVGLATADGLTAAGALHGIEGNDKPPHYIVEFSAGSTVGGRMLPRSSRIICRFADDPLDDDPWFETHSQRLAGEAGAAILSGFNEVPRERLVESIVAATTLAIGWRDAGLDLIHLELGDFEEMADAWTVMKGLGTVITSLGLSLAELNKLTGTIGGVAERMLALAERLALPRVCVHYDTFATTVSRGDPRRERTALLTGSLLASTRAATGKVAKPTQIPAGATFAEPCDETLVPPAGWTVTTCATPWLRHPVATIGLGDTFLAGTLLVLGA